MLKDMTINKILPDALILYCAGSGGEFLRVCCSLALGETIDFLPRSNGQFAVSETKWKMFSDSINNSGRTEFDDLTSDQIYSKLLIMNNNFRSIENGHHYFKWFPKTNMRCFYIEFDDRHVDVVIDAFIRKAYNNNPDLFYITGNKNQEEDLWCIRSNFKNREEVAIVYTQLQKVYSRNCNKIDIKDFWDFEKTLANIKTIIDAEEILNHDLIYKHWTKWISLNDTLKHGLDIS